MGKIRLGSTCITEVEKCFEYENRKCVISKGTYVTVCDNDNVSSGYVLVEIEGYDTVFDYMLSELVLA